MSKINHHLHMIAGALALAATTLPTLGHEPVIAAFGRNGELVCTNLEPGTVATVEWAPSVDGPWTNTWAGLEAVPTDSSGTIRVLVPMFYRVRGVPRNPGPVNPDPANLVWIAPGTFTMGSPDSEAGRFSDEGPQTVVTLTRGFWMGRHEVTQAEYANVMGSNPSLFQGANLPVEQVTWNDATNYCARLTERERVAERLPAGHIYRLPTEAEWEYACRAGTTTVFYTGDELRSGMANFDGRYELPPCGSTPNWCYNGSGMFLGQTTPVGSYPPNAWGLYDMRGNVREWCADWYGGAYPGGNVTDPTGPANGDPDTGYSRVFRGGSWFHYAKQCRSAVRAGNSARYTNSYRGFRVVLGQSLGSPDTGL